jgi:hypothetical protein
VKSLLAKFAVHKAVGLYLGEHEVAVSKVAATPLGPVELASHCEACQPEELPGLVERLLMPLWQGRRHPPVAVGVPSSKIFFGTRLARTTGDSTPEAVLQRALCSPNVRIDDLTMDLIKGTANRSPIASVAACRKKYMSGVIATLTQLGVRPYRTEPSPCALVRLAAQQHRFPRRSKTMLRVFLNDTHGLAVVVAGGMPLAWRSFVLPGGSERLAIVSAVRTLMTVNRHYGVESTLDYVVIHGRADLHERLRQEELASEVAIRMVWQEGPALSGAGAAFGLALGCLAQNVAAFDLSRALKPPPSIWDIFPWGELAFEVVLVAGMAGWFGTRAMMLQDSYARIRTESGRHTCLATRDTKKLEADKKDLQGKIDVVRRFLDSRILWSAYTHYISACLPSTGLLSVCEGSCGLDIGRGPANKSLVLRLKLPMGKDGSTSPEIKRFFASVRSDPLLHRDFTSVELSDIKQVIRNGKAVETLFSILCSAKGGRGPATVQPHDDATPQGKGKKEHGKKEQGKPARGKNGPGAKEQDKPAQGKNGPGAKEQGKPAQGKNGPGAKEQDKPAQGKNGPGAKEQGKPAQGKNGPGAKEQDKPAQGKNGPGAKEPPTQEPPAKEQA